MSLNSAGTGGAIFVNADATGAGTIVNCIIAGNTATEGGPDVYGAIISSGHNLIGITDGSTGWLGSDLTGTLENPLDPRLNPLGWYGGPTQTMTLMADSPALNAGDNAYVEGSVDQRGYTRIVGSAVDIGAVEMQDGEFDNTPPTVNDADYWMLVNQPLYVPVGNGLLTFASDVDFDLLTVVAVNDLPLIEDEITLVGSSGGTLTVYSDGSFEYTPAENALYDEVFSFTICDGFASSTASLTIHVTGLVQN